MACLPTTCVPSAHGTREGIGSSRTGDMDGCESLRGVLGSELGFSVRTTIALNLRALFPQETVLKPGLTGCTAFEGIV